MPVTDVLDMGFVLTLEVSKYHELSRVGISCRVRGVILRVVEKYHIHSNPVQGVGVNGGENS